MAKRVITASDTGLWEYLKKVWRYKKLILTFATRDLKVQYAQTFLGVLWSAIQPLTGLLIFTFFFGKIISLDTKDIPYPLFAFSGIMAWYFFTYMVGQGGHSLVNSQDLIKKIFFPKLVLPLSKVLVGIVEFAISIVLLIILMIIMGSMPGAEVIFFPLFILLNIIVGLAVAIWLSALTLRYRDLQHLIPYLVNFGIWVTPVFYPSTLIPEKYNYFLYFNPLAGVIAGFRWTLLNGERPEIAYFYSFIPVVILFIAGLFYFKKVEGKTSDIV